MGSGKVSISTWALASSFFYPNTPSLRKVDDGGEMELGGKEKKKLRDVQQRAKGNKFLQQIASLSK